MDHKTERTRDVERIKVSTHPRKIVVAGPGTGKSHLFAELIKHKKAEGKSEFLAITFIGKLGDSLADDLCGLATTNTMHSFARSFVLKYARGWVYYPRIADIIREDLKSEGIDKCEIGDANYVEKSKRYRAVGDDDVVHYAIQICRKDPKKIPHYDLILIDEYQDFNQTESELVDLLAQHNETVIVGDDDQALYAFKGSSPAFIRKKYDPANADWESFTLRFCSRCTRVIIESFHQLVAHFELNRPHEVDIAKKRIEKDFICYLTGQSDGRDADSAANPHIHLIKNCPVGMVAYKVKKELEKIVGNQKIKEVLIVGEGQSCTTLLRTVAQQLRNYGFKNVDSRRAEDLIPLESDVIDAYKFIGKDEQSVLGWRILGNPPEADRPRHIENAATLQALVEGTPSKIANVKENRIECLEMEIEDHSVLSRKTTAKKKNNPAGSVAPCSREDENEALRKKMLVQTLKRTNLFLPRPLGNLDITICNILNSKGLGADVVFLIGFDQGKLPAKKVPTESEIYQMLVAITRAKKRLYLVNTVKNKVSQFIDCLESNNVEVSDAAPER